MYNRADTPRTTSPRFKVTDIVEIARTHPSLSGRRGRVVEVRQNPIAQTLDKYFVLLDNPPEVQLLWDIDLKAK